MAYVAVDKNSEEWIYTIKPKRCIEYNNKWQPPHKSNSVYLPKVQ